MSQLRALVWLKWTLFRNSLRSRKAVAGRVASVLGTAAALLIALTIGAALGLATYTFMSSGGGGAAADAGESGRAAFLFMLIVFVMLYMMWAIVPLGLGGGSQFDAGRMLLYPISLGKLFVIDWLSELTSLSSIFAVPVVLGVAVGAGAARGSFAKALAAAVCVVALGVAFTKLLSTAVGSLMRRKRTRGEAVLAILGGALGLAGAFMGQLAPVVARHADSIRGVRWTPPGAAAVALSSGLHPDGVGVYALALATLAAYTLVFVLITYYIARRMALGIGGGAKKARARRAEGTGGARAYVGWRLPLMSPQLSALVEKELRYALRNVQLRVVAIMAVGLTIVLRLTPLGGGSRGRQGMSWGSVEPYAEGARMVFSVLYVFTLVSPLTTNLFGYDGAGMRSLVLAPLDRRKLIVGKNIAGLIITFVLASAAVLANGVIFNDLSWQTLLFASLSFVFFASLFALVGNWMSMHFPKRLEFGKRMNRSGVAGLLLVPLFLALLVPPALAVFAGYVARSLAVKYVILAAFALAAVGLYLLLLPRQGRALERRELEILESVTGRSGEQDGQVLG
jgi:hypothetical protein